MDTFKLVTFFSVDEGAPVFVPSAAWKRGRLGVGGEVKSWWREVDWWMEDLLFVII